MNVFFEKDEEGIVGCQFYITEGKHKIQKAKATRLLEKCGPRIDIVDGGECGVFFLWDAFDDLVLKSNKANMKEKIILCGVKSCRSKSYEVALEDLVFAINNPVKSKKPVAPVIPVPIGDTISAAPSVPVTDAKDMAVVDLNLPIEERAKAAWGSDPDLKAEFRGSLDAYVAFEKNMEAGRVKIICGRTVSG